jgi:hypothetical protein
MSDQALAVKAGQLDKQCPSEYNIIDTHLTCNLFASGFSDLVLQEFERYVLIPRASPARGFFTYLQQVANI